MATILSVIALTGSAVVATAGPAAAMDCRIDIEAAVIRSHPNPDATAMGIGYRGQTCQVTDSRYVDGARWAEIRMDKSDVKGWVKSAHLWTEDHEIGTRLL
ncbi:hypothetical protein [Streptomyces sp. PT12]|uniref:hypothetical protein n=1 Tax=Streptomyces sp. PT12 TaxID=1510197 RepID=UPI0011BF91C4|nr:hypothetical protein [Streptomyces sp. PT12]